MLSIENVKSAYGRIEVLHGVTLRVEPGEIVTLDRRQRRRQDHAAARDFRRPADHRRRDQVRRRADRKAAGA